MNNIYYLKYLSGYWVRFQNSEKFFFGKSQLYTYQIPADTITVTPTKRIIMKQRQSTRVAVLSKSMRVVDEDTRSEYHHLRLLALEVDNYQEQGAAATKDEEAFTLSDVLTNIDI